MRIRQFTISAGPNGARHPGEHDVPDAEARALIDRGHAERVGAPERATRQPAERATAAAAETREGGHAE